MSYKYKKQTCIDTQLNNQIIANEWKMHEMYAHINVDM